MWTNLKNIGSVLDNVSNKAVQEDECSIPDIYGKAIQFHLALRRDYDGQKNKSEVNTWRGLITLLALQKHYNLPLAWEKVTMPKDENLFCDSLKYVPANFSIFSNPAKQWNGETFYVLTWKKGDGTSVDLFLYSPATLVYPVADWFSAFSQIPELEWFDPKNGFDSPEQALGESNKKIVKYWLENVFDQIRKNGDPNSPSTQMILGQLKQYSTDLNVVILQPKDSSSFSLVPINGKTDPTDVLGALNYTVDVMLNFEKDRVPANELFSDQICFFKNSKDDIFKMCSCKDNYKVAGEEDLYAFLPLNAIMRKYCGGFNLAAGVSMTCIKKGKEDQANYIRARINLPAQVGLDLVKDYKMVDYAAANKGEAFSYFDNSLSNYPPLIAIWPNTVSDIWQRYYIMLDDEFKVGNLEIAGDSELDRTENKYVVQTKYVPDAIPLAIQYGSRGQGGPVLSIGMLSLNKQPIHDKNLSVHADVAVDFGTSSTRVFAKIDGFAKKREIFITDDVPLIIMTYGSEQNIMRNYFVANQKPASQQKNSEDYATKIFSIYKRDSIGLTTTASPILDGVIYQAKADEKLEDQSGSYVSRLMTNLKWGDKSNRPYYKAFLEQLCLHVTNYLHREYQVNKITWKYALPEIMNPTSKASVQSVWTGDIKGYLESMTDKITCTVAQSYETESNAASKYFLYDGDLNANAEKGYLVMDIGGGSTDLALWQGTLERRDMKWHDSVDVAGHSIFTRWVAKWLSDFKSLTTEKTLQKMIEEIENNGLNEAQNALVDRILTIYDSTLRRIYMQECDGARADHWAVKLRGQIICGVSILFFAVGCQVGLLAREEILKVSSQPGTFVIAVGGRGAKILDWTGKVHGKDVPQIFFDLGRKTTANGFFPEVKVQTSPDPKSEVARGLLELGDGYPDDERNADASARKLNYANLFIRFTEYYKKTFGKLDSLPALTRDDVEDKLKRYRGNRKSLINVFMQILYEGWAAEGLAGGRSQ